MAPHPAPPEPATQDFDTPEERFSSVLADWDERLAAGTFETPETPSGMEDRLARAVACVRLLRSALLGPPLGRRLGDFEIGRELGRGGMGIVYQARQVSLNRLVALKVLGGASGLTCTAVGRFRREAETAARLHHTNIVPIYATGEEDGVHYYAMELVNGPSLDRVLGELRRGRGNDARTLLTSGTPAAAGASTVDYLHDPIEPSQPGGKSLGSDGRYFETVARLIAEVADALHYAHQNGVIHRDIKPSNLLLSPDHRLRVNDFGLARLLEEPGMTVSGEFVGTPAYMSPEQIAAGRAVDRRTDVYSLGATIYEMLTLQPPFTGKTRAELLAQVLQNDPPPPRRMNALVPRDLETICLKALDKCPDRRYPSAAEMAADLRRFLTGEPVAARRVGAIGRVWKHARRRPVVAGLLAALVVLLIGGSGAVTVLWRQAETALAGEQLARQDEAVQREKAETELAAKLVLLARVEWEAARVDNAASHLADCPERHRGLEWRYLDRMCRAEVAPRIRLPVKGVSRIAYSPDGKWLATLTLKEVRVWDVASRAQVFDAGVAQYRFGWVGFTANGQLVVLTTVLPGPPPGATPPAGQVPGAVIASPSATWRFAIWDPTTRQLVRQSEFVGPYHEGVARSPAGPLLATMNGVIIRARSLATDEVVEFAHGHRRIRFLDFNANGRHLLSTASGEPIKVWDAATGRLLATIPEERLPFGVLEHDRRLLSPDGRRLLRFRSAEYPTTRTQIWDVENNREQMTFLGPAYSFNNTRFSPDGRCLAIVFANAVHVRDLATGRETHILRGHTTSIVGIAFAPDGRRLATISMDQTVREWDVSPYPD